MPRTPIQADMQANITGDPSAPGPGLVARQAPAMIWATDLDLRLTYVHRGMPTGHSRREQVLAATVYDVVRSRDPREPMIARHLAARGGVRQSFLYGLRRCRFAVVIDALRDEAGTIAGCVGAAIEIDSSTQDAAGRAPNDGDRADGRLRRAAFLSDATRLLLMPDVRTSLDAIAHLAVPYLADLCAIDLEHDGVAERLVVASIMNGIDLPVLPAPRRVEIHEEPRGTRLIVPLIARATVFGTMTCAVARPRRFTGTERGVAQALGRRIALALDGACRYQDARDEVAGRDAFLSIATHEIRGAITSMHLAVQGLLRGSLQAAAAQTALEVIQREDRRLGRFVDDLLDIARMRTGQLHFDLQEVDVGAVVRDVVARLAADIPPGGSPVGVATDGNLVGWWDRGRLEQTVTNLLSNAIKYGQGQPIEVTAVNTGDVARITVADGGIGIRPELLPRIFNPFQRGVDARTYGGLGLGLHIVRTIVEGLGGSIRVESQPGAGSTFTVDLPITTEADHGQAINPRRR